MPPNGEKQSQWLMGCKCGARVEASGNAGCIDRFMISEAFRAFSSEVDAGSPRENASKQKNSGRF
jgi:hypothetical protein